VWSYGITTVPERPDLLRRTLRSLAGGGFDKPIIFVDGPSHSAGVFGDLLEQYEFVFRSQKVGAYSHWCLTLFELFARNHDANRFAVFQDDFVTYKNLRPYLDAVPYPEKGYWNLYTGVPNKVGFKTTNVDLAKQQESFGFFESNQKGHGALGLVFDSERMTQIFKNPILLTRMWDPTLGDKNIDGFVVRAMREAGIKEYCHSPSLLSHTGIVSSMGNPTHPETPLFLSEDFDALSFLKKDDPTTTGLGDIVHIALASVGITPERVSDWLGSPCNCEERRQRMNQIGSWAVRALTGAATSAKDKLLSLLGSQT
jgi:hypothetical protein